MSKVKVFFLSLATIAFLIPVCLSGDQNFGGMNFGDGGQQFSGCSVYLTTNQDISSGAAATIDFTNALSAEEYDTDNYHDGSGADSAKVIVPTAGYYRVQGHISWVAAAGTTRVIYLDHYNTSDVRQTMWSDVSEGANDGETFLTATGVTYCEAGEYFSMRGLQTSGSNKLANANSLGNIATQLTVWRVGY